MTPVAYVRECVKVTVNEQPGFNAYCSQLGVIAGGQEGRGENKSMKCQTYVLQID